EVQFIGGPHYGYYAGTGVIVQAKMVRRVHSAYFRPGTRRLVVDSTGFLCRDNSSGKIRHDSPFLNCHPDTPGTAYLYTLLGVAIQGRGKLRTTRGTTSSRTARESGLTAGGS